VLTNCIETHGLGSLNVKCQRLVGGCGVNPISPEALIQDSQIEIRFVIKTSPVDTLLVPSNTNLTHSEIAFYFINDLTPLFEADNEIV